MQILRPIAVYLPQFHPIPENDQWWGKGFTEWTNVVKAKPRFKNHYQPHLPADLGFYDLRLPEIREQQAFLAQEYGIYGFCYYHYWFNGKRILERPFEEVFQSGKPNFPFCLCWANENWTRAWDGTEKEILLKQNYSFEDDRNHIKYLIKYFKDPRYIRVNEKPLFVFYKPDLFPDITETLKIFREEALKEGLSLYLCRFERAIGLAGEGVNELGFDAAIEFQPLSLSLKRYREKYFKLNILQRALKKIHKVSCSLLNREYIPKDNIYSYNDFVDFDLKQKLPNYKCYPCVSPMWDNSSRRVKINATIFKSSTPDKFGQWYKNKTEKFIPYSNDENFVFINAWNEWAEGNHLEPCQKWGLKYLQKIKELKNHGK